MRSFAPTTPVLLLLLPLAGMLAASPGCGTTVIQTTGSSAAGGDGAGGTGTGSASASSGPASASSGPASASSSSASASSSSAASASSGGTGGGATCSAAEKVCDGKCVAVDDPAYGCTPTGCAPCATQYPNAMQACMFGMCLLPYCLPGFKNCDQNDANGCEVDANNDPSNCGACGAICTVPHATASCTGGACGIATCDSGWTDCNNDPTDGCEANLQNDPMNCGACGSACPANLPCTTGFCVDECTAKGVASCPGDPPGVCTMLGTNKNCNFCNDTCNLTNATSQCQQHTASPPAPNWVCTLQMCNAGFGDCDMVASNGCETNTAADPNNCGACGNVCNLPNATSVCNAGQCQIASCNAGFQDCDHVASNGCEADTRNDWNNCGGCGQTCTGGPPGPNVGPPCENGMCIGWSCVMGYADCDGNPANGCEADLDTDPNNCRFCGNKCVTTCSNGVCAP